MEILICLDRKDIECQKFGNNIHIKTEHFKIALTQEAALELMKDLLELTHQPVKLYSDEEVRKLMFYGMSFQQACDYQRAGRQLIVDEDKLKETSIMLLDELCDEKNVDFIGLIGNETIGNIFEMLEKEELKTKESEIPFPDVEINDKD